MRFLGTIALILLGMAFAVPAAGSAFVRVSHNDDGVSFDVTIEVFNQWVEGDPTGYEIVVEELWVGACAEPTVVDAPPMPLSPYLQDPHVQYSFTVPAQLRDQVFLYRPAIRRPDGTIQQIPQSYGVPAYDFAVYGRSIAARGFLQGDPWGTGDFWIDPCVDDCGTWICYFLFDMSAVEPADYMPYWNEPVVVEIEGTSTADGMLQFYCLEVTAVAPAPAGVCGVVSGKPESWGGLKATYR